MPRIHISFQQCLLIDAARIERIDGKTLLQKRPGILSHMAQQRSFECPCFHIVVVHGKRVICKIHCLFPPSPACGQTGKPEKAGTLRLCTPGGFIESIKSLRLFSNCLQCQPEMEITLPTVWIRRFPCLFADRLPEIRDALLYIAPSVQQQSVSVVEAGLGRIPAQPLQIVVSRLVCGMAVLFQMLCCQIEFFRAL